MIIRQAKKEDNQRLIDLENKIFMGEKVSISFIKNDFFYKDKYFKSDYFICEEENRIIFVVAIGEKTFLYNGKKLKGGLVHLLRIEKEFQKKPVREFKQIHLSILKLFKERKFDFIYGIIKSDNYNAALFAKKRGYSLFGSFNLYVFPNYFKKKLIFPDFDSYLNSNFEKNIFTPEKPSIVSRDGVLYNEIDFSKYVKIYVKNVPKTLLILSKIFFGRDIIRKFEEKKRRLSYKIIQIINADSTKRLNEFIKYKRWENFQDGIEITAVINRTNFKVSSPIKYKNDIFLKIINPELKMNFSDFLIDLSDL